jgi:hypothetical protein
MVEQADTGRRSLVAAGVQRTRTGLAHATAASKRALRRVRGGERPAIGERSEPVEPSPGDQLSASPPDLADADASVQHAWKHLRLMVAIVVTVAPVVTALISWRVRVRRARRRGGRLDP